MGAPLKVVSVVLIEWIEMKMSMRTSNGFFRAMKKGFTPFTVVGIADRLVRRRC